MMKKDKNGYLVETDGVISQGFLNTIKLALHRYGVVGSFGRFIIWLDELNKFIDRGEDSEEKHFRKNLLKKFALIHKKILSPHSPYQWVLLAEYIFNLRIDGPIIQCGIFKGSSAAKMSLIAQKTGRKLYVCDSFAGLPEPKSSDKTKLKGHDYYAPDYSFSEGEYMGSLEEVKANIRAYGYLDVCEFIPGLFEKSLPGLNLNPAFIFIDVDFVSSARDCIKNLWPKLKPGGYFFTHEAIFPDYIKGIMDAQWWHETLGECPPVIMGGGVGISVLSPGTAYFQKNSS